MVLFITQIGHIPTISNVILKLKNTSILRQKQAYVTPRYIGKYLCKI